MKSMTERKLPRNSWTKLAFKWEISKYYELVATTPHRADDYRLLYIYKHTHYNLWHAVTTTGHVFFYIIIFEVFLQTFSFSSVFSSSHGFEEKVARRLLQQ